MSSEPIDIPLPDEPSSNENGQVDNNNATTTTSLNDVSSTNTVPIAPESAAQLYQQYYSNYYSAYAAATQPSYSYYVPVVPPMVPVIPIQHHAEQQANGNKQAQQENDEEDDEDDEDDDDDDDPTVVKTGSSKASNILPIHCNEKMNLNPLIYTNIQQSPYFKNNLFQLKTYHEVIDEIFYSVTHLEPWEKGSRKVGGQTGMCGSVRGVGAGGIISTPFCILYKLFTLKLTRKQLNGLIRHKDSPYIRSLGFMYVRYTQPPGDLWKWFETFLEDEEEVDPKAGGGQPMTIGQMCRHMLTKLDWFSTLFPRIPVPIQKDIEAKLKKHDAEIEEQLREERGIEEGEVDEELEKRHERKYENREKRGRERHEKRRGSRERERRHSNERGNSRERRSRSRSRDRHHRHHRSYDSHYERERERDHHRHRHHH